MLLSVAMVVALLVRVALVWSQLPDPVASHFGSGGQPDAFMSRRAFFVAMALVGGGSVALVFASPLLLRRLPSTLVNLPNREYWLANEQRRDEAVHRLAGTMGWIGAATTALLVIAIELTVQANLEQTNLDEQTLLACLIVYCAFVVFSVARVAWVFRVADRAS